MKHLKILVACEESQTVTIELRKLGVEAYSCDIQECSGNHPEWHCCENVLPLINGDCKFKTMDNEAHEIIGKWDLIIAHPPCTYMSNAGACRMYPTKGNIDQERYKKGLLAKEFFMNFYNARCDHIAIENPMPLSIIDLPKKSQMIQPYQFGDPWSKKTYLWLKGLPDLQYTNLLKEWKPFVPSGTGRKLGGDSYGAKNCAHSSKDRSKTFPGIAKAMATQWVEYILNETN